MSDVDELARIREENRLLIEDRSRFPDKPDAIGRIIDAYNANRNAKMVDLEIRCRNSLSEIARLREERLTNEDLVAICWARAGLLNDADETKSRGLRERSKHSREAAETLTRLLDRQPLPPGPEGAVNG